jgi:hypothetical protein
MNTPFKSPMAKGGLYLAGILLVASIASGAGFMTEFSQERFVYDYASLLISPESIEAALADFYREENVKLFLVTLGPDEDLDAIFNWLDLSKPFQGVPEAIPDIPPIDLTPPGGRLPDSGAPSTPPDTPDTPGEPALPGSTTSVPGAVPGQTTTSVNPAQPIPAGTGTIASFWDAVNPDPMRPIHYWRATGYRPCYPPRQAGEPDWIAIFNERACGINPADWDYIWVNHSFLGESKEGFYFVWSATNKMVAEVWKQGGMWVMKDLDGKQYDVAPDDPSHEVYDFLNRQYNMPRYSVHSVRTQTVHAILDEKYGAMVRTVEGGSPGGKLYECTGERVDWPIWGSVDEGGSIPLGLLRGAEDEDIAQARLKEEDVQAQGCFIIVLYQVGGELAVGSQGCIGFDANRVLENQDVKKGLDNKDYDGALNIVMGSIIGAFGQDKSGRPEKLPDAFDCEAEFAKASSKQDYGSYQLVYENCKGEIKLRARYAQAQLKFYGQEFGFAAGYSVEVYKDSQIPELRKGALRLAILSYSNIPDCPMVEKYFRVWETGGFEQSEELQSAYEACGQSGAIPEAAPGQKPGPVVPGIGDFYANTLLVYQTSLEGFNKGKYAEACSSTLLLDNYNMVVDSNPGLAKNMLSLLIRCRKELRMCISVQELYSIYAYEFGEDTTLKAVASACPAQAPADNVWPGFSSSFPGYKEPPKDTEGHISYMLDIGWELFNKQDYAGARRIAIGLFANYFIKEGDANRAKYPELFRSTLKLTIMSRFILEPETCETMGYLYYLKTHVPRFGIDEDIEAAWNACEGKQHMPIISECSTVWPTAEGYKVNLNSVIDSCEVFETAHPDIRAMVRDAEACCTGQDSSPLCQYARSMDAGNKKRCIGIYLIKGIGEYAKYVKDYFEPECNCGDRDSRYYGQCRADQMHTFNEKAKSLPCRQGSGIVWESDSDMGQNSCELVEPPAHVTLSILKTGTCADYSVLVTTALRAAGYGPSEVFTVDQTIHATNLVKLPGDDKYHHVDTTGNKVGIVFNGMFPGRDYNKVGRWNCMNDYGNFQCPDNSMIYERFDNW